MITPDTPLSQLYGVGPRVAEKLEHLGLETVDDLLHYYPRRYDDFSHPRRINQIIPGQDQIIEGRIVYISNELSVKKRMKLTRTVVADDTGQLGIVWFNQPFLVQQLRVGTTWLFAGEVKRDFSGNLSMISPVIEREGKIIPIYRETAGLSSKMIRRFLYELTYTFKNYPDWLTEAIRDEHHLVGLAEALKMIHFPGSIEQVGLAKKRLAFNELFLLLLKIQLVKQELQTSKAPVCRQPIDEIKKLIDSLPFTLTDSQRIATWQIIKDLGKNIPMNRLLEGDVGSGKTVVGTIAAFVAIKSGYQTVWMAPTEILAQQHYETCKRFLEQFNIKLCLLTGSTSVKVQPDINNYELIIGTQAVIQDKIQFDKLGLVIVDEQHRFGVKQRALLRAEREASTVPHFLSMTATPIPRTLALTIYGDLDISELQTVPTGRKPIISRFVAPSQRQEAYQFIRKHIKAGRQAFVVCPLVESSVDINRDGQLSLDLEEKRAAVAEYEKLSKKVFPDLRIGLIHGRLKSSEKEEVMAAFKTGKLDILVATAVIEVGIDIPNATVMMLEGAERFGLAQLHQFRGRVGRGEHQSYCFVFTDSINQAVYERLKAFTATSSGFELAELDLKLRGPGQLVGLAQSGLGELKIGSLSDITLIREAKSAVMSLVARGLERYPLIEEQLRVKPRAEHLD